MGNPMKVSEAASLALHTMVLLANDLDRALTAREMAETFQVSEAHLAKVLQRLTHAGLLHSERGPKGGFTLAQPADKVSLLNVYETIEGPLSKETCLLSTRLCGGDNCILGGLLGKVNDEFRRYMADTKLADITSVYEGLQLSKSRTTHA